MDECTIYVYRAELDFLVDFCNGPDPHQSDLIQNAKEIHDQIVTP